MNFAINPGVFFLGLLLGVAVTASGCDQGVQGRGKPSIPAAAEQSHPTGSALPVQIESDVPTRPSSSVSRIVAARKNIFSSYVALKQLAQSGDASAAYQLYEDLSHCLYAKDRQEALEIAAAEDRASVEFVANEQIRDKALCANLSDEQIATIAQWVTKAARLGHTQAQLEYFAVATAKFDTPEKIVANFDEIGRIRAEALDHLMSAVRKGNQTALFTLASYYHAGTLTKPDLVKAYAYMRVLQQRGSVQSSAKFLEAWRRDMTPEQIRNAEAVAADEMSRIKGK